MKNEIAVLSTAPLPKKKSWHSRELTEAMRNIEPGESYIFSDHKAARAYYQWLRYHGKNPTQVTEDGKLRVGRANV